jgi:hypothetical protein
VDDGIPAVMATAWHNYYLALLSAPSAIGSIDGPAIWSAAEGALTDAERTGTGRAVDTHRSRRQKQVEAVAYNIF